MTFLHEVTSPQALPVHGVPQHESGAALQPNSQVNHGAQAPLALHCSRSPPGPQRVVP